MATLRKRVIATSLQQGEFAELDRTHKKHNLSRTHALQEARRCSLAARTAKDLGLTIPLSILASADEVIE
jgi:hypothetical protein